MRYFIPLFANVALALWSPGMAANPDDRSAEDGASRVTRELAACREIADPTQRPACFDRTSTGLVTARDNKTIVVVDRAEIRQVNRLLFGFALQNLNLFGKSDQQG